MTNKKHLIIIALIGVVALCVQCAKTFERNSEEEAQASISITAKKDAALITEGQQIFRFDTFGDEDFWSGLLHLDKAILGEKNGGYGPGVSPLTALSVGLKVDASALPPKVVEGIKSGAIKLDDPLTTVELLKLNAVVGVKGTFSGGTLQAIGITCASCPSTVEPIFYSYGVFHGIV